MRIISLFTLLVLIIVFSCKIGNNSGQEKVQIQESPLSKFITFNRDTFPSYDPSFPPPPGVKTFELSQDYPPSFRRELYPWKAIDYKTRPVAYAEAVLKYCLQGNREVDFRVQENQVRKWYHAPWLHADGRVAGNGREYHHGLTRERGTPSGEIHVKQKRRLENWAIGFYNSPGGFTMGNVWNTNGNTSGVAGKPDPSEANFPEGTVSFKLLFSDATPEEVPFIDQSFEWTANIYPCDPRRSNCPNKEKRIDRQVRLLQIDIAVKDNRVKPMGWVFGAFIYDASKSGPSPWDRLSLAALSWGNDSGDTSMMRRDSAFVNRDMAQTYINSSHVYNSNRRYTNEAYMIYHGLGGRANGPIDNPISSCYSCHSQAAITADGRHMPEGAFDKMNRKDFTDQDFEDYFSTDIRSGSFDRRFRGELYRTTDYSLQVSLGIRNYYQNKRLLTGLEKYAKTSNIGMEELSAKQIEEIRNTIEELPMANRGEKTDN